jgi:hypothetical protein
MLISGFLGATQGVRYWLQAPKNQGKRRCLTADSARQSRLSIIIRRSARDQLRTFIAGSSGQLSSEPALAGAVDAKSEDEAMAEVYDEASKVVAKRGTVVVDGPDGVDVALTPEAATDTSELLLEAAAEAAAQRRVAESEAD